jgi:hypothetical protein
MRCASSSKAPINRHRRLSVALAAITGAVAIAACGSSSKATSTPTSGAFPQGIKYADCMRFQGVPNFPDPVFAPGGQGIGYNVTPGSLAYETQGILQASRACRNVGSPLPLRALTQGAP